MQRCTWINAVRYGVKFYPYEDTVITDTNESKKEKELRKQASPIQFSILV